MGNLPTKISVIALKEKVHPKCKDLECFYVMDDGTCKYYLAQFKWGSRRGSCPFLKTSKTGEEVSKIIGFTPIQFLKSEEKSQEYNLAKVAKQLSKKKKLEKIGKSKGK